MKLDEFHVDQFRARVISERMTVAGALPAVARDLVGPAQPAGSEHHRLRSKNPKPPALAIVAKRADHTRSVLQQRDDGDSMWTSMP